MGEPHVGDLDEGAMLPATASDLVELRDSVAKVLTLMRSEVMERLERIDTLADTSRRLVEVLVRVREERNDALGEASSLRRELADTRRLYRSARDALGADVPIGSPFRTLEDVPEWMRPRTEPDVPAPFGITAEESARQLAEASARLEAGGVVSTRERRQNHLLRDVVEGARVMVRTRTWSPELEELMGALDRYDGRKAVDGPDPEPEPDAPRVERRGGQPGRRSGGGRRGYDD